MRNYKAAVLLILFFASCPAFAQDRQDENGRRSGEIEKALFIAAASQEKVLEIGLVDCIVYALQNNSEILVKRIEPKLREKDVRIAQARFDPRLTADYGFRRSVSGFTSTFYPDGLKSEQTDFNMGVDGRFLTGTGYSIGLSSEKYKSSLPTQSPNPYYSVGPKITITQPLFRAKGVLVNTADITIAKNNVIASTEGFKDTVMDIITRAKTAYFNYFYYLENYSLARLSLERVKGLLEINTARYAKGLISSVDLLETETGLAQREKALLAAQSSLNKAEDELKLITNLVDDPEIWNAQIKLIDEPHFELEEVNLLQSLQDAFRFRPDYQSAKIGLDNRDIKVRVAKNEALPVLDLAGSFGLNGLGEDYQQAIKGIGADYPSWSAQVKFSLPWPGEGRAKYDQRKLEKAQALIEFKRLEQDIILQVRDKVRQADLQYRQAQAAKILKEKEGKNYQAQKERYAAGQISTHNILDYQEKLLQAEVEYVKALVDYSVAVIELEKAQGLTLVKNDIKLEE